MRITLHDDFGTFLLVAEDGRDLLIQTDFDFPGVASTFGWSPCSCGATDGTVDCDHKTAEGPVGSFVSAEQGTLFASESG